MVIHGICGVLQFLLLLALMHAGGGDPQVSCIMFGNGLSLRSSWKRFIFENLIEAVSLGLDTCHIVGQLSFDWVLEGGTVVKGDQIL